jgi:pilus assembly protein FimV
VVTIVKKSNVRVLTKTLAVVSLLAPASGHPLGIGEIKLHSALNQNLDAEISLTLSGESVSDIKVSLAPPEKFDEAGVSWNFFLSKIKFETITQSNGSVVIKLTSKEALKEPFLDFLLEVSWPKGNLYREFTVLVDPPSVYSQATIPVSTSTESYVQPPVASPQPQSITTGQSSDGQYGPVPRNDTLWSVAEHASVQSDVSVEQMMIAIYEANPHAFYKGNVHALMAGKMLTIPEREVALKLSRSQAIAEFNRHTQAWKNRTAPIHTEAAKEKPALSGAEESVDNQLTLAAPIKEAVSDEAIVTSEQVSSKKKSADVATDGVIQNKVAELEKQLAMMQELIALKDQQLAALQNQSQSQANPVVQEQTVPSEVVTAKPVDQAAPPPQAVTEPTELTQPDQLTESVKPVESVQPIQPVESLQPVQSDQPKPGSFLNPYYLGGGGAVFLTLLGWLWKRKRRIDRETNTESMFASSIMIEIPEADENISAAAGVDTAAHDAGTVGESSFLSEFTPSDFDSFDTDQGEIDPISEADVYLAYGRYQQAEELIRQAIKDQPNRDECKLKLLEIFYANENNAAFEAYANELVAAGKRDEVGFWEKTTEMGRELCPDSPLFISGNDLFAVDDTDVANSNESIVRDNGTKKATLNTGVAYFGESVGDNIVKESTGSKANELDFDLTSFEAEDDSFVDEQRNSEGIDFDLSSFSMELEEGDQGVIASSRQAGISKASQIESVNYDLSSFSIDAQESDEEDNDSSASSTFSDMPSATSLGNKEEEFESLEFDFSSNDVKTKGINTQDFSLLENGNKNHQDDDFSLDRSLTFNDDTSGDFDFDFELDLPSTTRGQDPSQHDEFGVSDLTDMDELETKLDLAKAYVDMGDAGAAKDIAREVLEHGTAEQKKIAKTLLDELN